MIRAVTALFGLVVGLAGGTIFDAPAADQEEAFNEPPPSRRLERRSSSARVKGAGFLVRGKIRIGRVEFDRALSGLTEERSRQIVKDFGPVLAALAVIDAGERVDSDLAYLLLVEAFADDPEECFEEIMASRTPYASWHASALFDTWVLKDPEGAQKAVETIPAGGMRRELMSSVIMALAVADPEAAIELMTAQRAPHYYSPGLLFRQWAEKSLDQAREAVENMEASMIRERALIGVASAYAKQSPEEALSWATALGSADRKSAVVAIFRELSSADALASVAYVESLDDDEMKRSAVRFCARTLAEEHPQMAYEMVARGLTGNARYVTIQNIVAEHFKVAHLEHYERMVRDCPVGAKRDDIAITLAGRYALEDPESAAEWLRQAGPELNVDPEMMQKTLQKINSGSQGDNFLEWGDLSGPSE
jgi:hypothetical protein